MAPRDEVDKIAMKKAPQLIKRARISTHNAFCSVRPQLDA